MAKKKKTIGEVNVTSKSAQKRIEAMQTSPVPTKKIVMLNFPDAIREVLEGKRLTRVSWEDNETFILLRDEFLMIHIGGKYHQLITSLGDMEGIDWMVLPQSN